MVRDYRAGLGMPRRAKVAAVSAIAAAGGLSAAVAVDTLLARVLVVGAAATGVAIVLWRVPTRETVAGDRHADRGERSVGDD